MPRRCWAAGLGECGSISREHYVSAGLWTGPTVDVLGFPWCKDKAIPVGLESLVAKVLCIPHNSALSDVDQAGIRAFNAIRQTVLLGNERERDSGKRWPRRRFEADGPMLERWFTKTAANLCSMRESTLRWTLTGEPLTQIPSILVDVAFGRSAFVPPMGLYSAANLGEQLDFREGVTFAPLLIDSGAVGFTFTFMGMRFLLWVMTVPPAPTIEVPGAKEPAWHKSDLHYHLGFVRHVVRGRLSHYLQFVWPGAKAPYWLLKG